ncbi:MBL fold metallo-hydrolase [Oscillospiraceae bacterium OttesenSCG-928-G22]|nr:MBL fold metallo-hydrolase [Oscillospiraceae bacterium OttesenSCG-928-G22]
MNKTPKPDASGWYEILDLGENIFAILEPHHFQEVISYLIVGTERAILFDTGMNLGNIREAAERLTDLPIDPVNSHAHFDHMGGNHLFSHAYAFDSPKSLARLAEGYPNRVLQGEAKAENFAKPCPGFDAATYHIPPSCPVTGVPEGYLFRPGGRELEVIHTPGHSPDSIMLFERATGRLFAGDVYYPATLYAHIYDPKMGGSDISQYADSFDKLRPLVPKISLVHSGHNDAASPPEGILDAADAFRALADGSGPAGEQVADTNKYGDGTPAPPVYKYKFESGVKIIARDRL